MANPAVKWGLIRIHGPSLPLGATADPQRLGVESDSCDTTALVTPWVASEVSCCRRRRRFFEEVVDGAIFIEIKKAVFFVSVCWRFVGDKISIKKEERT